MSKVTVARALTARIARRFVRLGDIIIALAATALLAIIWALAYFVSPWWWLLLLPIVFVVGIYIIIRCIVAFIIARVHVGRLSREQRTALDTFIDKIQQLLEARATPLPIVAIICIKDILLHRDVTTIKKIINDSVGLRRDYVALEKLF